MVRHGGGVFLMQRFDPGCCCCPTIGFDESAWSFVTSCCSGMSPIINLASERSRLSECKVVFGGNNGTCGNAIRFSSGNWSTIKSYLENGGRMFIAGEHCGNHTSTSA